MSVTLKQATDTFLLSKRAAGRSKHTLVKYRDTLCVLARRIDGKCLEDVTTDDVRHFLADRREAGHAPTSLDTYYRALSTFFRWCVAEYGIPNPMERVERPRVPKRLPPYLSDEAIKKLLEATSQSRCPLCHNR
ncbi:MAG: site-specific integrase [Chloroflexota bacterium]